MPLIGKSVKYAGLFGTSPLEKTKNVESNMSEKKFDPQTLDNYESFHKEFTPYEWARLGIYGGVFAPFGWFIGSSKLKLDYL